MFFTVVMHLKLIATHTMGTPKRWKNRFPVGTYIIEMAPLAGFS